MPFCPACGTKLNDDFRFCPHCGRPTTTTGSEVVQRSDDPRQYEEATLRLRLTIEYQVLYSGKGLFGAYTQKDYVQIGHLDLMAMSHAKGEYVSLTSEQFRGFQQTPDLYPSVRYAEKWTDIYKAIEQGVQIASDLESALFAEIIRERKSTWDTFCALLSKDGWFGIADDAVRRKNPLAHQIMLDLCDAAPFNSHHSSWYKKSRKEDPNHIFYYPLDPKNYRYRRQV